MRGTIVILLLAGAECSGSEKESAPVRDSSTTESDTGLGGPCLGGTWGFIESDADAIHVDDLGSDSATGASDDPVATLEQALALTRVEGAPKRIAIWPGTYASALVLTGDDGAGGSDDALTIQGCGSDETFLVAPEGETAITAGGVDGWLLEGVEISEGRRGLNIWKSGSATIRSVRVTHGERQGILMDGSYGRLEVTLEDVEVEDITGEGGELGYGVAVQGSNDVVVTMTGGGVRSATGVGVLVSGYASTLTLDGTAVESTAEDADGLFGRGIQVQDSATATIRNATLTGNADAGIFALYYQSITLDTVTVSATAGVDVDGGATRSGDGIVLTQGVDTNYDVTLFPATLAENVVTGSERAGVLASGVWVDVPSGRANDVTGNGYTYDGLLLQDGATATGDATYTDLDSAGIELAVNGAALDLDDPSL